MYGIGRMGLMAKGRPDLAQEAAGYGTAALGVPEYMRTTVTAGQAGLPDEQQYVVDPNRARSGGMGGVGGPQAAPSPEIAAVLHRAAQKAGLSPEEEKAYIGLISSESGFDPNADASPLGTSAKGLAQIVDGTWDELVAKHPEFKGRSHFDPEASAGLGAYYFKQNLNSIDAASPGNANRTTIAEKMHIAGPGNLGSILAGRYYKYQGEANKGSARANAYTANMADYNMTGGVNDPRGENKLIASVGSGQMTASENTLNKLNDGALDTVNSVAQTISDGTTAFVHGLEDATSALLAAAREIRGWINGDAGRDRAIHQQSGLGGMVHRADEKRIQLERAGVGF